MNFPRIFDIFSRRRKESERMRISLTKEFRNRVIMLCNDGFAGSSFPGHPIKRSQFWSEMHINLKYLHGRPALAGRNTESAERDVIAFLDGCSDEHFLDFVEYASRSQAPNAATKRNAEFIRSVNEFFDLDALPFHLTGFELSDLESVHPSAIGIPTSEPDATIRVKTVSAFPQVICKEDQILHQEAIEPTLLLLKESHFTSANEEFLEALKDYRKGDYRDSVGKCGSSLESVMKVICARKKWAYQETDVASKLIKTISSTIYSRYILRAAAHVDRHHKESVQYGPRSGNPAENSFQARSQLCDQRDCVCYSAACG